MKHADTITSYGYMKEHLYTKPQQYENSFRKLESYLIRFKGFGSLAFMLKFINQPDGQIRLMLKQDLFRLDKEKPWLRPEITEMLIFILWDDLVLKYGTEENFSEGYYDLMMELSEA